MRTRSIHLRAAGMLGLALLAACDSSSGGSASSGAKTAESGTPRGSAGGFSAVMSSELAKAGIGADPAPIAEPGSAGAAPAAGSAAPAVASAGSAAPATGSAAPAVASAGSAASAAGSAAPVATSAGSAAAPAVGSTAPVPATGSAAAVVASPPATTRAYVKPAPDIAAIKFDLEPNWERDMGEAGTFSLVVKVPGGDAARVFSVKYGYEDSSAPIDCDGYRKYLEDKGVMKVTIHRQRGPTCYIEGTDQAGVAIYRSLLTYGGKRLVCIGSLYKDAASSALGDLRDKVLMQGKKICETLAL